MSNGKRVHLLTTEFERFGMARPVAANLSSEAVLRHPLAHRVGVPRLASRLIRHGLQPEDAHHLALTLWGLERLMLGACFQDLLDVLRRAGVEESRAYPACIEARRMFRDAGDRLQPVDVDPQIARWCVAVLVLMVVIQGLLAFSR